MATTTAAAIVAHLAEQLRQIQPPAWQTDAGGRVYVELIEPDSELITPAVSVMFEGEQCERVLANCVQRRMVGQFTVAGWVRPLASDQGSQAHALVADIKRAVFPAQGCTDDAQRGVISREHLATEIDPLLPGAELQLLTVSGQIRWAEVDGT